MQTIANFSRRLRRRITEFRKSEEAATALIFGITCIPLLAIAGVAMDYSRATSTRNQLQTAADAAALAAAKKPYATLAERQQIAEDVFKANVTSLKFASSYSLNFTEFGNGQGARLDVSSSIDTTVSGLLGVNYIPVSVRAEVMAAGTNLEVALVLDNTGSMNWNGKIAALRESTEELIDILYEPPDSEEKVKMALVPFVTTVNIKTDGYTKDWIDRKGRAARNGFNFDGPNKKTHHWKLFKKMNGVSWKGCVEARPEPFDLTDEPPIYANADSLWVPYLWPDEPDNGGDYSNDYMDDGVSGNAQKRQRNWNKYYGGNPSNDETPSSTRGPNKSCPQPILPLTNNVERIQDEAAQMTPWFSSGTNIALGLAWGWRVLSPGVPFTEGVPYDDPEVQKAIILLTDGRNEIVGQDTHNDSDYTGFGYVAAGHLGTQSRSQAVAAVNAKVATLCERVKDEGIRVYTITFQLNDPDLDTVFQNCASEPGLYYKSPTNAQLRAAFQAIALDLSNLRLSR